MIALIWVGIRMLTGYDGSTLEIMAGPATFLYYWYWITGVLMVVLFGFFPLVALKDRFSAVPLAAFGAIVATVSGSTSILAGWLFFTATNMPDENSFPKLGLGLALLVVTQMINRAFPKTEDSYGTTYRSRTTYTRSRTTTTAVSRPKRRLPPPKPAPKQLPPPVPKAQEPPPLPKSEVVECDYCNSTQHVVFRPVSSTISCQACGGPIKVSIAA